MRSIGCVLVAMLMTSPVLNAQEASADSTKPRNLHGWSARTFTSDEIRNHPARDLRALMSLMPGFVALDADGGLYGRGSRNGQLEYRLNGIDITDRFTSSFSLPFLPEALEQVTAHVGPYSALLGSAPGGLVDMRLRTGGERWEVTAQHRTDDFAPTGSTFLGTSSFGQHTTVLTAGGPLPFDSRLFVAAEFYRMRDRDPRWVEPFSYNLQLATFTPPYGGPFPAPFEFKKNHHLSNSLARSSLIWNLTTSLAGIDAALWGTISDTRTRNASEWAIVRQYYNQHRIPWWDDVRSTIGLTLSGTVSGIVRAHGIIVRNDARSHTTDPDFGEDRRIYPDSAANAAKGYTGFRGRYYGPQGYFTDDQPYFVNADEPNNSFLKTSISNWRALGSVEADLTEAWTIAVQAEAEWWTLRSFNVSYISGVRSALDSDLDGVDDRTFTNERELEYYVGSNASSYGFDANGGSIDDGWRAARRPSRTSLTAASRWRAGSFELELGLRGVWDDTDVPTPIAGDLPRGLWPAFPYDNQYQMIEPSALGSASTTKHWLPRASASVKEGAYDIRFAWGKYLATLPFSELQLANSHLRNILGPYRQPMWYPSSEVLTSSARPEITTASEAALELQLLPQVRIGMAIYSKDMSSQVQLGFTPVDTMPNPPTSFVNTGESRSKGVELTLLLNPSPQARVRLSYAYQDVQGMSATPRSNFIEVTDPTIVAAQRPYDLDYEQAHRIVGELQLSGEPGTWLETFDLWLAGRAASGHPYTRFEVPTYTSLAPWYGAMMWAAYPQGSTLVEPRNASRTPWTFFVDLSVSYRFTIGPAKIRTLVAITNLLNTKEVVNVFPTTGSSTEDGWLRSELGRRWIEYSTTGIYASLYRDLMLRNRHAYLRYTGNDIYAAPRQVRLGLEVGL